MNKTANMTKKKTFCGARERGERNYEEKESGDFSACTDRRTEEETDKKHYHNSSNPGDRGSGDLLCATEK